MSADELLVLLEAHALRLAPESAPGFIEGVREDLAYMREELPAMPPPGASDFERAEYRERPRPTPPSQYAEAVDTWIVFSAFVTHFLDPIGAAVEVLRFIRTEGGAELERFALTPGVGLAMEDVDVFDLERLESDYKILVTLAAELGEEAFGDAFRIGDFVGEPGEET